MVCRKLLSGRVPLGYCLSLGVFYALLNLDRAWTRIVLVAVAIAAGVIFNWLRVTSIVLIGHHMERLRQLLLPFQP